MDEGELTLRISSYVYWMLAHICSTATHIGTTLNGSVGKRPAGLQELSAKLRVGWLVCLAYSPNCSGNEEHKNALHLSLHSC